MNVMQSEKSGSFGTVTDLGTSVIKRYTDFSESYYEELNAYALDAYAGSPDNNSKVINLLGREGNSLIFTKYYPVPPNINRELLFVNCCLSLHEFYIRNLSHQDIALRNILVDSQGLPVLIDIGATTRFGFDTGIARSYPVYSLEYNIGHYQDIYLLGTTIKELWSNPPPPYDNIINSMVNFNIYARPTTAQILQQLGITHKPQKIYPPINSYLQGSVNPNDYNTLLNHISKLEVSKQVLGTLARLSYILLSRSISQPQITALLNFVVSYIGRKYPFDSANLNVIELAKIDFPCNPYWYDIGLSTYWFDTVIRNPTIIIPIRDIPEPRLPSIRAVNLRNYNVQVTKDGNTFTITLNLDPSEYIGVLKFANLVYPTVDIFSNISNPSFPLKNSYLLSPDRIYLEGIIAAYNNKYISITSNNELTGIRKINATLGINFELKAVIGTGITLL